MCIWAAYAGSGASELGSSFTLLVLSWIVYAMAGILSSWERIHGVPEAYKRRIGLGTGVQYTHCRMLCVTCRGILPTRKWTLRVGLTRLRTL